MAGGMSRDAERILGFVFLGLMVLFLVLAITTFEGTPTLLLIVGALVFLGVGLFFFSGSGRGSAAPEGPSQQQSVVLSDGQVVAQGSSGVLAVCGSCGSRVPERFAHCPDCGKPMGA